MSSTLHALKCVNNLLNRTASQSTTVVISSIKNLLLSLYSSHLSKENDAEYDLKTCVEVRLCKAKTHRGILWYVDPGAGRSHFSNRFFAFFEAVVGSALVLLSIESDHSFGKYPWQERRVLLSRISDETTKNEDFYR